MLEEYLNSRVTVVLLSIVWGLGMSTLFHRTCVKGKNCEIIHYQGPPMTDNTYYWTYGTEKCHKIRPYVVKC